MTNILAFEDVNFQFVISHQAYAEADQFAKRILTIPPVIQIRQDSTEVIQKDPALQGLFEDKLVVTDISASVPASVRAVMFCYTMLL